MAYIQVGATGKTVYVSTYNFLFKTVKGKVEYISDDEIAEFYQSCLADDLGNFMENPFIDSSATTISVENEEDINIEELPEEDLSKDI